MESEDPHAISELIRELFDEAVDLLCVADFDGYFRYVNSAFTRVLGWSREELTSRPFTDFVHPDDIETTLAQAASIAAGVSALAFENRYRTRDGEYRWLSWNSQVNLDRRLMYGTVRDVTAEHENQDALRRSEREARFIADAIPHLVWMTGAGAEPGYLNQTLLDYFGYSGERTGVLDLHPFVHPEDSNLFGNLFSRAAGETRQATVRLRRHDGVYRWNFVSVIARMSAHPPDASGWIGTSTDIDDLLHARTELRDSERGRHRSLAILEAVIANSPLGMAFVDTTGRFQHLNRAFARLAARPVADHIDRTVQELYPGWDGRQRPTAAPMPVLWCIPGEAGPPRHFRRTSYNVESEGKLIGFGHIMEEVTSQVRLNQEVQDLTGQVLQAQDEERRRIARELHDSVAQSISAISINLSMARSCIADPAANARALRLLNESANLASATVQELRTISYLLHPPLLDELGLASALRVFTDGFARRSAIAITLDIGDIPRLPLELETTLFRIVQESLNNVHRHAESPTASVTLKSRAQGGLVELSIADQGRGFDSGNFASVAAAGVGLRGMRERVAQFGGVLRIESGPAGTVVTAEVPVVTHQ